MNLRVTPNLFVTQAQQAAALHNQLGAFFDEYANAEYDIWKGGRSKARRHTP